MLEACGEATEVYTRILTHAATRLNHNSAGAQGLKTHKTTEYVISQSEQIVTNHYENQLKRH